MYKEIFSKENTVIKTVRALQSKNGRKKYGLYFIEGTRIVKEALQFVYEQIAFIVISNSFKNSIKDKSYKSLENYDCYVIPDNLFSEISDTETPQGILAVLKSGSINISDFSFTDNRVLILDSVRDPGNIGTIVRTAEAMGFNSIFLTKGSGDVFSPKVLRSTMGSAFRTNIYDSINISDIKTLKNKGYTLISTALCDNSVSLSDAKFTGKIAVVIGNEANGVSDDLLEISDHTVKIPMEGKTESLNAAVAAAIVMYHFSHN